MTNEDSDERISVSNTYSQSFVDKLMDRFDAAIKPSQAVRMAVQEAVNEPNQMSQEVADEILRSLDRRGGEWESVQTIRIHSAEDVEIGQSNSVEVNSDADE